MIDEGLLSDALNGRATNLDPEMRELARLAGLAGSLPFPGPDSAARLRMTMRFDDYITRRSRPGLVAWLAGWLGAGPRPRAALQRLAAGGVILLVGASGASAATGQTPIGIATGIASFAENVVHNLVPRSDGGAALPVTATSTPSPTGTPTPPPTATPTPPATSTATGVPPAADDSGGVSQAPTGDSRATPTPPPPSPTKVAPKQGIYSAGEGGTVRLAYTGSSLTVISVQPSTGWQFTIRQASGQRVEVTFSHGGRGLSFYATIRDGQPIIQLRTTIAVPANMKLPIPEVTRIPTPQRAHGSKMEVTSEGDAAGPDANPEGASP